MSDTPKIQQAADGGCPPATCSSWLCNMCGHKFTDMDAESVEVSPECEECTIACPKCWANILDDWGSLTPHDDSQYDWRTRHKSYLKYLYVENPPTLKWDGDEWIPETNPQTSGGTSAASSCSEPTETP